MRSWILSLLFTLLAALNVQAQEEEFLPPNEAFKLAQSQIIIAEDNKALLRVKWEIAKNYYMYRSKISFTSNDRELILGEVKMPEGELKHDEFFGDIRVFHDQLTAEVPLEFEAPLSEIHVTAKSQGCAEAGICYPPLRQQIKLPVPEALRAQHKNKVLQAANFLADVSGTGSPATASSAASDTGTIMDEGINNDEDEFLDPEQAFRLQVDTDTQGNIVATWMIEKGYYLYQDKFNFELLSDTARLGNIDYPKAKEKKDEILGNYKVYSDKVSFVLPVLGSASEERLALKLQYQGCAEAGICYPLQKKEVEIATDKIQFSAEPVAKQQQNTDDAASLADIPEEELSEQDALASYLTKGNNFLVLLTFFGLGLALAFTPCVFPMIPILSGIIAGQGDQVNTRKAFVMSVVYVLAMAVTYTIAGVIAGLSGENIQIWFQNPWVIGAFAGVFVLLALSMFGFYELQLPSSLQSKITEISNKQQGGAYTGVMVMGFLSALIVGPCVAPPLMGALIYISQTGDPFLGGGALFFMSLGMGLPLIAIGTSAGKYLPRAGVWMDAVKAGFGIMMLGLAIWMLERVLAPEVTIWLWALLLIYSAIYIGALTPITENTTGWGRFRKASGLVMLLYGAILIIGAAGGQSNLFQPLKGMGLATGGANTQMAAAGHVTFNKVTTVAQLQQQLDRAKAEGKYVMLDYFAKWCISCIELEKFTFSDPAVKAILDDFVLIQADVTEDNQDSKELLKKYGLIGPPAILFFDPSGKERRNMRVVGFKDAPWFVNHLNKLQGK